MTFLNPSYLWVLPLAVAPVLLHLINKRPPKKILFSHLAWLKDAHRSTMPRKKMQDLLLMIVRTLLILLLVLFFSRPIIHKGDLFAAGLAGKAGSQDASMIILMDVSASMGLVDAGRPVLDAVKEQLGRVLPKIPAGVRVGLVVYSDKVEQELAPTLERSRVTAMLENLKARPKPTNVLPALRLASSMLANQPRGRKSVLIVSDQAAHGWAEARAAGAQWEGYDPETSFVLWEIDGPKADAGIAEASLQLSEEGVLKGHFTAVESDALSSAWTFKLNNHVVGQGTLPPQKGRSDVPLQAQLPEGGFYSGQLSLAADALPFDDAYYIAGRVPKGFRLLIVDGESGLAPTDSESYYLKSALESPRDPRLKTISVIRPELLVQENFSNYDAIVLANVGTLGARQDELLGWVERGGGLFVTAGAKWPKPPESPLKVFRVHARRAGQWTMSPPKPNTPVLSGVAGVEAFQWDQITVTQYVQFEPDSSSVPLLALSGGDPALVRKQIGKGFVYCLTTSVDRAWTNLPAKPIFAPLMRELIASLADPLREQTALAGFIDEPVKITMPAGVSNVTVVAPDGTSVGAHANKDGTLVWPAPQMPGLFQVKTDRPENDFAFAVNIRGQAQEQDLTRLPEDELKTIFPKASTEWVAYGGRGEERVIAALEGKDATPALMACLFLLLATETFVGWPRKKNV